MRQCRDIYNIIHDWLIAGFEPKLDFQHINAVSFFFPEPKLDLDDFTQSMTRDNIAARFTIAFRTFSFFDKLRLPGKKHDTDREMLAY